MSYSTAAGLYGDPTFQGRAAACVDEQAAQTYIGQTGSPEAGLASGVLAGNDVDRDAIIRQATVAPTAGDKATDDLALLSAVQFAWPLVAAARYPS